MSDWKRVSNYAEERGTQTICTVYVDGCTLHVLYEGNTPIRHFEDKEEAFRLADEMRGEK